MNRVKLEDVCVFINGGAWSDKEYVPFGIPVLKVSNCKSSGFDLSEVDYLPVSSKEKYLKNKLVLNDVIIATVGSHPNLVESAAGRSCIVNSAVCGYYLNQNAVCIRTVDPSVLDQKYLGYMTKDVLFQHYIQMRGRGAANQMRIAISSIKSFELVLPPIESQIKIADILSTYDNLIENNKKQIKLLEVAAQRLYKEWFVDLRFPGYENTKIEDGVPEGWRYYKATDVFEYIRGKSYTSKEISEDKGTLMVNLKNIKAFGNYNRNSEKRYTGKYSDSQSLSAGDVIMGVTDMTQERRLVGHVAIVPDLKEPMTFSMDIIKLIPKISTSNFVYSLLHFGGYSNQISRFANGVNVLHLKPEVLTNIEVLMPTNTIIEKYDSIFEKYRQQIEILQNQIGYAEKSRDMLLPRLMSGEVEV